MRRRILVAMGLVLSIIPCACAQSSRAEKATPSADNSDQNSNQEGCKLLPYTGSIPLEKTPGYVTGQIDVRGGVLCHYRISPELPVFNFSFLGDANNNLGTLEITEDPSTTIVQKLERFTDWGMVSTADELEKNLLTLVDANFDGYKDLQILSNCGATGNCSYDFFIYDSVTNRFVHDEFLSNNLCSPGFDAKKKQIVTHSNSSASDWGSDTYQYEDGHFTLIRQEISSWDSEKDKESVTLYELRNGKMELVGTETKP
jgi:hypothetical protein